MSEIMVWSVVVGVAAALAAISMLCTQVEHETRSAFEAVVRRFMARLSERTSSLPGAPRRRLGA